jgi:hypothetical protein
MPCGGLGSITHGGLRRTPPSSPYDGRLSPLPDRGARGCLSQGVSRGESAVGVAGASVGGAGAIGAHHRPRPPPSQAHRFHFGAALDRLLVAKVWRNSWGLRQVEAGATCEESPYNASRPALRAASGRPPARQRPIGTGSQPTCSWPGSGSARRSRRRRNPPWNPRCGHSNAKQRLILFTDMSSGAMELLFVRPAS